ncbi:DUF2326 domain-containing protein [Rhizobium leguminosarum]|nr:DUF2326 domain-containing protein [Rhizobium leguminosarum]TBE57445.1 DUF2326 domain-containing protein [Rhizobium leguminosarum]TBE95033.1 DUF2326 domain-containing protein [Rhizobium leguminosarum]TBZ98326.1 DUF2326 domain-containing protein [Rhizobium leguminosarum bv. viciae]
MFRAQELQGHSFWGEFEFAGINVRVERKVSDHKFVSIRGDDLRGLETEGRLFEDQRATIDSWCRWLGNVIFKLPLKPEGTAFDVTHAPTFRSLFPYFARRRDDVGFQSPQKFAHSAQSEGSAQIALSYLLGLDWLLARDFELEREEKRNLNARRKQVKARRAENLDSSSAILSAMAVAAHQANVQRERVASFQVAEHYEEMVRDASAYKNQLEKLSVEATSLRSSLAFIEESLEAEQPADIEAIEELYLAAGTQLPGSVVKTFNEIAAFHQSVAENRRHHLSSQMGSIRRRLATITAEMETARNSRDDILRDLRGKGAFSDLAKIQQVLAQREEEHAKLQTQYKDALEIERGSSASRINESHLLDRLQKDLITREAVVSEAVLAVVKAEKALYGDRQASFEISATKNGPVFKVTIEGDGSGGISNMEIFCFDYALYALTTARFGGPGMLIHDSHLFDPVDSRQIATAIQLGSDLADQVGGQYIVMLNSDFYDRLPFDQSFDAASKVLDVRLDDTETGGLFGFRFG